MVTEDTVGSRIRMVRTLHGWSLEDLAKYAGMSRTMLWYAEQGEAQLTIPKLQAIARALGVTCAVLLGEAELVVLAPTRSTHDG